MKQEIVINDAISRDIEVLVEFIKIYCSGRHGNAEKNRIAARGPVGRCLEAHDLTLCRECGRLLLHAVSKRLICPYDPKPSCKKCLTHCYAPGYREKIREVMRFSGMRLIRKGGLGLIKKIL